MGKVFNRMFDVHKIIVIIIIAYFIQSVVMAVIAGPIPIADDMTFFELCVNNDENLSAIILLMVIIGNLRLINSSSSESCKDKIKTENKTKILRISWKMTILSAISIFLQIHQNHYVVSSTRISLCFCWLISFEKKVYHPIKTPPTMLQTSTKLRAKFL